MEDLDKCSCDMTVESSVALAFGEICYLQYNDPSGIVLNWGFMEGSLSRGCHLLTSSCFVFSHSRVRISVSFILPRCKAELANSLDLVYRDDYLIYRQGYVDTRYMHPTDILIPRKQENTPKKKQWFTYLCVIPTTP